MNAQTPVAEQEAPRPKAPTRNLPALVAGGAVRAIVPQNIAEVWRMAELVHQSAMAPYGIDTQQKVAVALMHGMEIGLLPMQALQSIAVINNKPTLYGDAALAMVRASGLMEGFKEWIEGEGDNMVAKCRVKRKDEEPIEAEFSVGDAKKAELWTKRGRNGAPTPWQTYPKRMLKFRARAFALRDTFADVLKGMSIKEEVEDYAENVQQRDDEPPAPPPPPVASPPVVPSDVIEGELVEQQQAKPEPAVQAKAEPQEELTMASLYEEKAPTGETVWEDTAADEDGPPDPNATAPVATTVAKPAATKPVKAKPAKADPASNDDMPSFLDQRGRTPETDRMKGSLLRGIETLDGLDDYSIWMRDAVDPIAGLPTGDQLEVRKAFISRLKSKLIGQIKLLEDAEGFQGWAADARDGIDLLPVPDQVDVRNAFAKRQEDVFKAGG